MVQNKEDEDKPLTNGEILEEDCEKVKKENLEIELNGHESECEESDDDDYLDHLLMLPPLDKDTADRNRALISKSLLDFCTAIESKKEYQKIKLELLLNSEPIETKQKEITPHIEQKPTSVTKEESPQPIVFKRPNEVNKEAVAELRRQSIRLKKAQFVPEHEPEINDQFFVCRRCTIFFRTRKLRKLHNLIHHRRKWNGLSKAEDKPKQRLRRSSSNKDPFICDLCQKLYKQKALLRSHMNTHLSEPKFFCTLCPYASKRNNDLKKHHESHHNPDRIVKNSIRRRKCDKCEDQIYGKKAYKLHLREKHPPQIPVRKSRVLKRQCEKCEEVLEGMKAYRLHIKKQHSETSAIRCETCHRKFKTNFRLKKHEVKYAESGTDCRTYFRQNGVESIFECQQCDKKFLLKSHLSLHSKKHLNLTCDKCNVTFKNRFNLKWHEFSHLDIEPKCSSCALSFTSEQKFAVHLKKKVCSTNGIVNGTAD